MATYTYWETTSRRVRVDGVDGQTLRLHDLAFREPFTLIAKPDDATVAAAAIGRNLDVRMRVRRCRSTYALIDGDALSVHAVSDYVPTVEEAQEWFRARYGEGVCLDAD